MELTVQDLPCLYMRTLDIVCLIHQALRQVVAVQFQQAAYSRETYYSTEAEAESTM